MVEAITPLLVYAVTFAPTVAICLKVVLSVERSILNPVSLLELSLHESWTFVDETRLAIKFLGAAGVEVGVGVGVGFGVGVGVGVGLGVGVGVGVGGGLVLAS